MNIWHTFKVFKLTPTSSLSLGKYFKVGKLWIFTVSTSLAVESILAITTSSRSLNFSPSSSQIGASFLQWPHHGASAEKERKYSKNWPVLLFWYNFSKLVSIHFQKEKVEKIGIFPWVIILLILKTSSIDNLSIDFVRRKLMLVSHSWDLKG